MVTAGGLIFTGTRDRKVRALDATNGKVLWEHELDAALEGMPAVYEADGRQYVLFCAAAPVETLRNATRTDTRRLRGVCFAEDGGASVQRALGWCWIKTCSLRQTEE